LFLGRKAVAARCLEWLCDRSDVEVVGVLTDSHLPVSATSEVAKQRRIPLLTRATAEAKASTGELEYDLAVSVLYWLKIRKPLLEIARKGIINFHPAPLPDFKGTGGYNLAILRNLPEWGVSAHYVDQEIDTGPIIEVEQFPIDQTRETAQSLEKKCREPLFNIFATVVGSALKSQDLLPSNPNIGGIYVNRNEMEAMKEIRDGDDIPRKIRAFWYPPYDGAYININGLKYTIVDRYILNALADPTVGNIFMTDNAVEI